MFKIELLSIENFNINSLDNFQRKHDVKRVYRKHDGKYVLIDYAYTEDWNLEERRSIARAISSDDYITYLAIENNEVVGFIGLKKETIESYLILAMMYVSSYYRRRGIGKALFEVGRSEAQRVGAKALYISACSSEETIAFYKSMGAELTDYPINKLAEKEPCDLQMVCYV